MNCYWIILIISYRDRKTNDYVRQKIEEPGGKQGRLLKVVKRRKLYTNVKFLSEYRDSNILCFTKTWWCTDTPTENTHLEGFGFPYRQDRDNDVSGKKMGGGVCMYVNERWCKKNAVIVRASVSTASLELLTLSFRPNYLPRDFGQIFVTIVYCQPKALEKDCLKTVRETVDKMNQISPAAPHIICGDFNQNDLKKQLPNLYQYVSCATRKNAVLDKCYGNIKSAYRSLQKAPLGDSDHCTLYMLPQYVTKLKREPVEKKTIKIWNSETIEKMKACLETTDWDALTEGVDVSEAADVVASYIQFCESTMCKQRR